MKGRVKTKFISILLIIFILADMFSPYSILLNKSYAADELDTSNKYLFLKRMTDIKTATDVNDQEVRYFNLLVGITGDYKPDVIDLEMKYNTSKLALIDSTYKELSGAEVATKLKVKKYMSEEMPDIYTTNYGSETLTSIDPSTGRITVNASTLEPYSPADQDIIDMMPDYGYEVPEGYNGMIPLYLIRFKILDSTITKDNLTTDLIGFNANDRTPTGISVAYTSIDGVSGELQSLDYVKYDGFASSEVVKNIQSVTVKTSPTKVTYEHGDTIDLTGGILEITYTDGSTEEVNMNESSDLVLTKTEVAVGDTKVTGRYKENYTIEYPITVTDPVVSLIVTSQPSRTESYNQGDTIELAGAKLKPVTKSGVELAEISLPNINVSVDSTKADISAEMVEAGKAVITGTTAEGLNKGKQTITLSYEGSSTTLDVYVNDTVKEISSITGAKTSYTWGDELDLTTGTINVTTTSGSTLTVPLSNGSVSVTGYDKTKAGDQTLTVTYMGKIKTLTVNVDDPVVGIKVDPLPTKTTYNPEEQLDLSGAYVWEVRKSTNKVSQAPLTADMISGYDNTKPGTQTLTVSYKGKTTNFDVTVLDTIKSIEVTGMKTQYSYLDTLDYSNAKVKPILYSGAEGAAVSVTADMILSTFDSTKIGNQDITIQYQGIQEKVTVNVADVVSSISVKTEPQTRYKYGEALNIANGVITVNWASGAASTEENITANMVREADGNVFNSNVTFPEGQTTVTKPLTINYGGVQTTYNVTIVNEITGIAMKTTPKTTYNVNDALDVTGGEITITRQVGTEDKAIDSAWVSGLNTSAAIRNQPLTVTYTENNVTKTTSYNINVVDQVKSIAINTLPTQKEYGWGEELNLTGGKVDVTYGSGTQTIDMTRDMIKNYNKETTGNQDLVVEFEGKTAPTTYDIKVVDKLVSIAMKEPLPQTEYKLNEAINKNGYITITRQSGATEDKALGAAGVTITGFDSSAEVKNQRLTVTYAENYSESNATATTNYDINVIDKITKIEVTTMPSKVTYLYNDLLSTTGGKVTLTKASGNIEVIDLTSDMVTGYNKTTLGEQTLTVTYTKDGVTQTCTYKVTVNNYVDKIEIVSAPTKTTYGYGDSLDLTGGSIRKIMADGSTDTVELSDAAVTIVNKDTITQQIGENLPVTVEYAGKQTTFNITVADEILDVTLDGTIKTVYNFGDEFDSNGAKYIIKTKAQPNGTTKTITTDMVAGFRTDSLTSTEPNGTRTMTITVLPGKTFDYAYSVNDYVKGIELTAPTNTIYYYENKTSADVNIIGATVKPIMASGANSTSMGLGAAGVTYDKKYIPNQLGDQIINVNYEGYTKQFTITVKDKLTSIELVGTPKTSYIYGDNFAANGAKVKVNYLSKTSTIDLTEDMISNFFTSGNNALTDENGRKATVSYSYRYDDKEELITKTVDFTYTVADQVLDVNLVAPIKNTYFYGEDSQIDLVGGTVQKVMKSGIIQAIVSLEDIRNDVTGFISRPTTLGTQTISVNYAGITKTFDITVKDRLEGISIQDLPEQTYFVGDTISLTGAKLSIDRLKNDELVTLTADKIDDFTTAQPTAEGQPRTATITMVEDGVEKSTSFTYTVKDYIKGVDLIAPRNNEYFLNDSADKFDLTGGALVITMASGKPVTNISLENSNVTITPFNSSSIGEKTMNVSYTNEKGETLVAGSFTIKIFDQIKSVTIAGTPKAEYFYGDNIDLNGATLTVEKISGITNNVSINPDTDVTGFNTNALGERTATVRYTENGTFLKVANGGDIATFNYKVIEYNSGIASIQAPTKEEYYLNDTTLDLDGGYIELSKASGADNERVDLTDSRVTVTGFDTTSTGVKTITVSYTNEKGEKFSKTFNITVKDKLSSVEIEGTPKAEYFFNDALVLNGARLKVTKISGVTYKDITADMVTGFTTNALGEIIATVTYTDNDQYLEIPQGKNIDTFDYKVIEYNSGIASIQAPGQLTYHLGDSENFVDGYIELSKASGANNERIYLNDSRITISGFNTTSTGVKTITVSYTNEKGDEFSETFDITVRDELTSVEIEGTPKTDYKFGEDLALNGARLKVTKLSGVTYKNITADMVTGFTTNALTAENASREATVTYTDNDQYLDMPSGTYTDTFDYTVKDYIVGVTLKAPSIVEYVYGTELNLSDAYLIISMRSGNSAENVPLTNSDVTITGYNKNQLGAQTVQVEYKGFTDGLTFGVNVINMPERVEFNIDSIGASDYKYGENLKLGNASAVVVMKDGTRTPMEITNAMISGYNPTKLGEQTVTVTIHGFTSTVKVNVVDYVANIKLTAPTKELYIVKEQLDLTGGKLDVTMASGAKKEVPLTSSMISGFVPTKLGPQTVKVTYEGLNKEFPVLVVDKLADISIEALPKTIYKYGEELDLTGAKLRVTNESDSFEIIEITKDMVSGYNPKVLGDQEITVTYKVEGEEPKTTSFMVVVEDYVKEILFTKPEKSEYKWGEELDLTGAKFTEMLASGKVNKVVNVTPEMVSKFNNKVVGKQTLTAMYGDTPGEFQVSVIDKILSMAINNLPNKVEYLKGENIDLAGGKITIIKNSGVYNFDITSDMISGFDPNAIGTQILTVKYQGFEAQLAVTVKEEEKEVVINKKPSKRPSSKPSNETVTEEVIPEGTNTSEEETNSNASENKDKENNNDVNKDVTLGVKEESGDKNNEANMNTVVKTVTVSGLGIVALIALVFVITKKNNVKVYEEDEDELILVGKEKVSENNKEIDISKYVQNAPDKNIIVVLDKNISKKLDKETLKIKIDNEELETVVDYEDGEFEIRIEK